MVLHFLIEGGRPSRGRELSLEGGHSFLLPSSFLGGKVSGKGFGKPTRFCLLPTEVFVVWFCNVFATKSTAHVRMSVFTGCEEFGQLDTTDCGADVMQLVFAGISRLWVPTVCLYEEIG